MGGECDIGYGFRKVHYCRSKKRFKIGQKNWLGRQWSKTKPFKIILLSFLKKSSDVRDREAARHEKYVNTEIEVVLHSREKGVKDRLLKIRRKKCRSRNTKDQSLKFLKHLLTLDIPVGFAGSTVRPIPQLNPLDLFKNRFLKNNYDDAKFFKKLLSVVHASTATLESSVIEKPDSQSGGSSMVAESSSSEEGAPRVDEDEMLPKAGSITIPPPPAIPPKSERESSDADLSNGERAPLVLESRPDYTGGTGSARKLPSKTGSSGSEDSFPRLWAEASAARLVPNDVENASSSDKERLLEDSVRDAASGSPSRAESDI